MTTNSKFDYENTHPISFMIDMVTELLEDEELDAAYRDHRKSAHRRGVLWNFTKETWLKKWIESSHLHERGKGKGTYCLCRYFDKGEYSPENTYVALNEENNRFRGTQMMLERGNAFSEPRGCIIDGTYYHSLKSAARAHNVNHRTVSNRIANPKFKEWRAA